jgi:hypothetical protein
LPQGDGIFLMGSAAQGAYLRQPSSLKHQAEVADAMHALLVKRADELIGCVESSPEEAELQAIVDALEAAPRQSAHHRDQEPGLISGDDPVAILLGLFHVCVVSSPMLSVAPDLAD